LMTLENYPLALKNLTKATNFTSDPDLYLDMGKCQQALMQPEEAKKAYQLAMFMVPTRFIPRYMLMELYRQKNDTINSLLMGRSILQIKPKVPSQEVDFYKKEARKLVQELGVSHSSSLLRSGKLDSHGVKVFHPFGKGKFKYIKSKVTGETN